MDYPPAAPAKSPRIYAVASGKGGTGKTTVSVHLAWLIAELGAEVQYADCDVEEPNGHLFLKPATDHAEAASVLVPEIDATHCTACGKCAEACQFNAMAILKTATVFPDLCHACGACALACPANAIRETPRATGMVETGRAGAVRFIQGRMNVGEPVAGPLIRAVKRGVSPNAIALLDSPPGTACPVVATVRDADYVILVTEPTPFGLNDLRLAVELMRSLGRRCGVIINRSISNGSVRHYCRSEHLPILAEIPDSRAAAEAYSRGEPIPECREALVPLARAIVNGNPEGHCQ